MRLTTALALHEYPAKPVLALTGAGGKSSLLFRLGAELAGARRQVLMTTTTQMWAGQIDQAPFSLVAADPHLLAKELPISLRGYRQVLVLSGPAEEPGKRRGLAPEVVCWLATLGDVDAAVVEADGSRERLLKAPAAHEPVVPSCATHVIAVAGMAAVGQPLGDRWVHRPRQVTELTGLEPGAPMTPDHVADLLVHPQGGLKNVPPGAVAYLYLNLALAPDTPAAEARRRLAAATLISRRVLVGAGYCAVLIGSAQAEEPVLEVHGRVAGVVLAAGASRRLKGPRPKQLLPWGADGSTTLVGHTVDTALQAKTLNQVLVVVGHQAERVAAAVADQSVRVVVNERWAMGQSSSVHAGLDALAADTAAAVFLLADQPEVRSSTVDALVEAHRRTLAPIVVPVYQGEQRGNPVLFDRKLFPELMALKGDRGGRVLIERYREWLVSVAIDQPLPLGIDTQADYRCRRGG